jgi:hypothetical protein
METRVRTLIDSLECVRGNNAQVGVRACMCNAYTIGVKHVVKYNSKYYD